MKTLEVLNVSEAELTAEIKKMKLKELEKHADKLLKAMGQSDYDGVLTVVIKSVPKLGELGADRFVALQGVIRKLLPESAVGKDHDQHTLERLALIMMVVVTRKYDEILAEQ
jgi:hypothetical protein